MVSATERRLRYHESDSMCRSICSHTIFCPTSKNPGICAASLSFSRRSRNISFFVCTFSPSFFPPPISKCLFDKGTRDDVNAFVKSKASCNTTKQTMVVMRYIVSYRLKWWHWVQSCPSKLIIGPGNNNPVQEDASLMGYSFTRCHRRTASSRREDEVCRPILLVSPIQDPHR